MNKGNEDATVRLKKILLSNITMINKCKKQQTAKTYNKSKRKSWELRELEMMT